jgi:hypothetical protein
LQPSQRRGESALDGDELEQVVPRRRVLGTLDQRGDAGEQDAEAVGDRLQLSTLVHATMMASHGAIGKCGTLARSGPVPSSR